MSSSAKQRSNKGGSSGGGGNSAAPSEKGAASSHPDDVAKKQQHNPAHAKASKGGSPAAGGGGRPPSSSSSSSFCSLGKLLNFVFFLVLVAWAAFSGYYVHHLLEEVKQIGLRQEGLAKQRDESARTLEGAVQTVQSLQSAFGGFELTLKSAQQKQEVTDKAVRQGESEIIRISEVLQKLQNEILKDLSDGIHVVKDARERDFTSLENTVEERLTELTRSINDNIAEFTDVQKKSQDELNEVKTKVASLGEAEAYKHDLQMLKGVVNEMQMSMRAKEKTIESLQSTIDSMESDVLSEVRELINLKQEHEKFKEAADTEHLSLQALEEKVLKAEESVAHLPDELKRFNEELLRIKTSSKVQEVSGLSEDMIENLHKSNEGLESRLGSIEENLQTLESLLPPYDSKLAALEQDLGSLRGTLENDVRSVTDTVRSLSEAQLSMYSDVDELQRSVSDLPNNADALDNIQKQVRALLDQEKPPVDAGSSKDRLEEFSSMKGSIGELQSSFGQVKSDLKMLRVAVDNLVAYSVKIEANENNVQLVQSSLDNIKNDLDRLFVKVEKIHEKV